MRSSKMDAHHLPLRLSAKEKETYEGRGETGEAATKTKKVRKWDEGPSGEVKRMETLMSEGLSKIKPTDPL